jgi:uncharacterized protein (TIGR03118 family)
MRSYRTAAILAAVLSVAPPTIEAGSISVVQTNLVTDDQSVNLAQITDPHLKNPWGVSFTPNGSPFWVSENHAGLATMYAVDAAGVVTKGSVEVTIPALVGAGTPTGQVFNAGGSGGAFNGDTFVFVSEDGTVSGWRPALGNLAEVIATGSPSNVYKGATEITNGSNTYLLAANFKSGAIDVYKGTPGAPDLTGKFVDPNLTAGFAPFNIQLLAGKLYVTYAVQAANMKDDAPGAGHGIVSAFDLQGNFLGRIATQGTLNSPWGLTIAPSSFGSLAGDLLVGNFRDGTINAFNLASPGFDGQLTTLSGQPLAIDGLWSLTTGGSGSDGDPQTVYFTSGPGAESHGLFGALATVPEPSSFVSGVIALVIGSLVCARRHILRC